MCKMRFKYIKRLLVCMLTLFVLLGSGAASAESQIPYDGYTYWTNGNKKSVYSKAAFEPFGKISSEELKISPFNKLTDFCVSDGKIYILDGNGSRITILDSNYTFIKEFYELKYNGEALKFTGANGIFVKNGKMYVCDTENERLLVADEKGLVNSVIKRPDSPIIPSDFRYRPIKMTADSDGYLYVLTEGSFYGALLFSPSYEFIEFFGANSVVLNISTVFNNIVSRIFPNNAKKSASVSFLPFSIVDLCMREDDFVYTVTGSTSTYNQKGQIRKLFVGTDDNILENTGSFTDKDFSATSRDRGSPRYQDLCSIDIDENGFIYALDSSCGRVFVYDSTGYICSAFGGGLLKGEQVGTFLNARVLAINGEEVLVMDTQENSLTVFKPTEFFKLLSNGQSLTLKGEYKASQEIWKKVLSLDSSCQLAYSGLARAEYASGNYVQAKNYARKGYDRDTYSLAFKMLRTDFITNYFWIIMIIAIIVMAVSAVLLRLKKRRGIKLIKNSKLQLAASVLIHPINSFTAIKEKRLASVGISAGILVIYYVTSVLTVLCGGFMFTYYDPSSFNSIWLLVKSLGLVVLWIVSNWLVCSLMSGNGRISEIITVACYSLIPLIINQIIQIIFTNVLLPDEATFLSIINMVAYILFLFMLTSGSIIIHEYGFGKFIGTSAITVAGMAIIVFLIFLIVMLLQQLFGFISTVVMEIQTF